MDRNNGPNNDATHRHQSRLQREMQANRLNPFNSPPSSTGSHGTVSTTTGDLTQDLSNFSFSPEGESTRKFNEDIKAFNARRSAATRRPAARPRSVINTSALARAFPEWSGLVPKSTNTTKDINQPSVQPERASRPTARPTAPASIIEEETKDTIPAPSEDTIPVEHLIGHKRPVSRAEMQPRVETVSNCSTDRLRTQRQSRVSSAQTALSPLFGSPVQSERPSIQDLVSKLRPHASTQKRQPSPASKQSSARTPKGSPAKAVEQPAQPESDNLVQQHLPPITKSGVTARSFLLPQFRHIPDLTSGSLKFSTMRDGVPVFVKHGKARTQFGPPANEHDTVDAIDVPEEDKEIFVSMDKIREEVQQLQEHDEMVQREAETLQTEIGRLQNELKRFRQRKLSDSAFGSGSESDVPLNRALEHQRKAYDEKIIQLQSRLEQASRQVGVHDIHSAALTAERDEALHQASAARERAKKLQAELEDTQREMDTNMSYRQDKETLELENTSLRAANDNLREQHESVATDYQTLAQQNNKLHHDNTVIQRELASVRQELQSLQAQFESVQEERMMLAQDHASLERNNDTYFKDNKVLRAKIEADNQRIADLEKGLARRDQLIEEMQSNMTTHTVRTEPAGLREQYAALEDEVRRLRDRAILNQKESDDLIQIKDDKIKALLREVSELHDQITSTYSLRREIVRLQEELKELKDQEAMWQHARNKNGRLTLAEHDLLHNVQQLQDEINVKETKWAEEKSDLAREIQRKDAAVKAVKETTRQITDHITLNLTTKPTSAKPVKVARIVDPSQQGKAHYSTSEQSARSEALDVEDDPTTEVHMPTQESDFLSIFTDDELPKLKQHLGDVLQDQQTTEDMSAGNTVQTMDSDLPSLPGPVHRRSRSDNSVTQRQKQPASILKKSSQFAQDDTMTGNYSVRSGHSAVGRERNQIDDTVQSHVSAKSFASHADQNLTSAFIIPDITLREKARAPSVQQSAGPTLSKQARSVLDSICVHKSQNCTVCSRIHSQSKASQSSASQKAEANTKKRVRVQKPTPVTERAQQRTEEYVEEPTLRPSMPPGNALAIVIKELQDEISHLEIQIQEKNKYYFGLDKSIGQRERKRALMAVQKLQREYESKSAQVYKLHDVLEGQKAAGQLMTQDELDVTIASICGPLEVDVTHTQETARSSVRESTSGEWKGFD